jgi:RNA polymerase sigma-70 factor, ECF subfamily
MASQEKLSLFSRSVITIWAFVSPAIKHHGYEREYPRIMVYKYQKEAVVVVSIFGSIAMPLESETPSRPDPDVFMRLFFEHEHRLAAFIASLLPNLADAEDLQQEVATVLWAKFGEFRPGSNFFAWACQVAKYKVLEHCRKAQRGALLFSDEAIEQITAEIVNMGDMLDAQSRALAECVAGLSEPDRALITHRYQPAQTLASTCQWAGKSHVTVRHWLRRTHRLLAKCIETKLAGDGW